MDMIKELKEVLQREQDALLKGDFDALEVLVPRKEALSTLLSEGNPNIPESAYQDLMRCAVQNDALLQSVQRGLQAALTQVQQVKNGLEQTTYSSSGERRPLSQIPSVTQRS
ncbi:MAG: hypothetical protein AAGL19_02510 [Pseudomonadota bacterium]